MKTRYFLALSAFLGSFVFTAHAQMVPIPTTPTLNTNASEFAQQAGIIAGTAQACGQDISTLTSRSIEVINALTRIPNEQQLALQLYEKALVTAQENQTKHPVLKCTDVLSSYNSLPILKSDYKQTVIPAMTKLGTPTNG